MRKREIYKNKYIFISLIILSIINIEYIKISKYNLELFNNVNNKYHYKIEKNIKIGVYLHSIKNGGIERLKR